MFLYFNINVLLNTNTNLFWLGILPSNSQYPIILCVITADLFVHILVIKQLKLLYLVSNQVKSIFYAGEGWHVVIIHETGF